MKLWKIGLILGIIYGFLAALLAGVCGAKSPSECMGISDVIVQVLFLIPIVLILTVTIITGWKSLALFSTPIICGGIGAFLGFMIERRKNIIEKIKKLTHNMELWKMGLIIGIIYFLYS